MVWFTFTDDFDWRADKRVTRHFPKGATENVPHACAELASSRGKGVYSDKTGAPLPTEPETEEAAEQAPESADEVEQVSDDSAG